MEHPRGVIAQDGKVWVLHPPLLSVFLDEDGDGTSDRQDVLVSGLTTSQIDERGGDHTTNGIRMGLDGWIYIAVGDYGFHGAKGKDGTTLSSAGAASSRPARRHGLEVFAIGLRNPFAIAIDPYLNLFTRDNTNDGAGWDVRVSHLIQTADYGYTQRFANFPDEIMPPSAPSARGAGRVPDPGRRALAQAFAACSSPATGAGATVVERPPRSNHSTIRRAGVRAHGAKKRRLKPTAILISAFEIEIRRPGITIIGFVSD